MFSPTPRPSEISIYCNACCFVHILLGWQHCKECGITTMKTPVLPCKSHTAINMTHHYALVVYMQTTPDPICTLPRLVLCLPRHKGKDDSFEGLIKLMPLQVVYYIFIISTEIIIIS
jgi:hypothetical protein